MCRARCLQSCMPQQQRTSEVDTPVHLPSKVSIKQVYRLSYQAIRVTIGRLYHSM